MGLQNVQHTCKRNIKRRKREKGTETNIWSNNDFPQINAIHQTTDPGSSENTKKDKSPHLNKKTPITKKLDL